MLKYSLAILLSILILSGLPTDSLAVDFSITYNNNIFLDNNTFPLNMVTDFDFSGKTKLAANIVYQDKDQDFWLNLADKSSIKIAGWQGRYYLGYTWIDDGWYQANADTITFFLEKEGSSGYSQNQYDFKLRSFEQKLEGITVGGNLIKTDKLQFNLMAKFLDCKELTYRNYNGKINNINGKYYLSGRKKAIYSELSDQTDMRDVNFRGSGYSLGWQLDWRLSKDSKMRLKAEDVYSKIHWKDVYTIDLIYNNNSIGFYSSLSNKGATMSSSGGTYGYMEHETSLIPEYSLEMEKKRLNFGALYYRRLYPFIFFKLTDKPVIKAGIFGDSYAVRFNYGGIKAQLATESLDLNSACKIKADLQVELAF